MVDNAAQLDTSIEIVTPENIAFEYRVAGPFRRLPAYLIDLVIRIVAAALGMYALTLMFFAIGMGESGVGLGLVLWFVLAWFYGGVFETYFNGQTPGKRMMHIRVVSTDGQPISGWQAVLRNVLRFVDGQPMFTYQVGLVASSLNKRFQRLGDLVSGTMVVVEDRQRLDGVMRIGYSEVIDMAATIPPNFQPSRTLARTLATYVMRRANFSPGRRVEIARHVAEPLCERFRLPPETNPDLLLCALYHRIFVEEDGVQPIRGGSPFGGAQPAASRQRTAGSPAAARAQTMPDGSPYPVATSSWRNRY